MAERLYKVLGEEGRAYHGGTGIWSLPHDDQPGDWVPPIEGPLVACENGYHLCREQDLILWLGPAIYTAEYRGERLDTNDKIVVRESRLLRKLDTWNGRTMRLFACDCADRGLHVFERDYPTDSRPRDAIATARRYAKSKATQKELDAAWDAARAASRNAARAASRDAARAAAWDAARAAAWDAAWAVARAVARDAAWAVARDAARDAAWAVARDAERKWQTERLLEYLGG